MRVMVAPNGARLTGGDHPKAPLTIAETVACAAECFAVGAEGLHGHVRGVTGNHSLDHGLYRELLDEMRHVAPDMRVQITTELAGRFTPDTQRDLVHALAPKMVSIALREQLSDGDLPAARTLYFGAQAQGTEVQHILYDVAEVGQLEHLQDSGVIPKGRPSVLFVLGRYGNGPQSSPEVIDQFLSSAYRPLNWMVAAFGQAETACLLAALKRGGAARVGFENNWLNADGSVAVSNAERVKDLYLALDRAGADVTADGLIPAGEI